MQVDCRVLDVTGLVVTSKRVISALVSRIELEFSPSKWSEKARGESERVKIHTYQVRV